MTGGAETAVDMELQSSRFIGYMGSLGDPFALLMRGLDDPNPVYEQVRDKGPLHLSMLGTWVTGDHALGNKVLRDPRLGTRKPDGTRPTDRFSALDDSFLRLDPPDHTRLRRLAFPLFSQRQMAGYRAHVQHVCDELLDRVDPAGFDLVGDFARHLPITLIRNLLGVPDEYTETFDTSCRGAARVLQGYFSPEASEELERQVKDLYVVFDEMLTLRESEPGTDVMSDLVRGERAGTVTRQESLGILGILAVAGTETTTNLIANGTKALFDNPDQWQLLLSQPDLAPQLVEETLRWDPPAPLALRVAHEDLELAGREVKAGDMVAVVLAAANRDPAVFPDPAVFDITRVIKSEHLTFSGGPHYCLGAPLARMEADVAFRTLIRRLPGLRQNGPATRWASAAARGHETLPVAAG